MSRVLVVDSGVANIGSVCYALERLGADIELSADPAAVDAAERLILPGVGAAGSAMRTLRQRGLVEPLRANTRPLLGICLGMQLLFEESDEGSEPVACLGLIPGHIRKLRPAVGARIPHMGWNTLQARRPSPLLEGIGAGDQVYFVHSFAADVDDSCIAACDHGSAFAAVVQRGCVAGAQFHPERSGRVGARILQNFLDWDGR